MSRGSSIRIFDGWFGGAWLDDHIDPALAPNLHPRPSFDELADDLEIPVETRPALEDWVEREIKVRGRAVAAEAIGRLMARINEVSPSGAAICAELGLSDESLDAVARRFRCSKQNVSQIRQNLQKRYFSSRLFHRPPDESKNWILFREIAATFKLPGEFPADLRKTGDITVTLGPDSSEVWVDKDAVAATLERVMRENPQRLLAFKSRRPKKEKDQTAPVNQPGTVNGSSLSS